VHNELSSGTTLPFFLPLQVKTWQSGQEVELDENMYTNQGYYPEMSKPKKMAHTKISKNTYLMGPNQ
jgi:hypothetical protein